MRASEFDEELVEFSQLWERRQALRLADDVAVAIPAIPDLIRTKRFAARPRDLEDIRLLEILREDGQP